MGPEGLPILLILFKGGYHVSILGSHLFLEGVQGQGQKQRVIQRQRLRVQGQGKYGGFKGKAKGDSRAGPVQRVQGQMLGQLKRKD